jgi:hypothetical protein
MPECQFLFSAIFMFEKSYTGNILGIGRNESQSSYLPDMKMESKGETESSRTIGWHRPPPSRATRWCGPPSDIALLPINSLRRENPKAPNTFSMKHTASHRRR